MPAPRKDRDIKDTAAWLSRHGVAKKHIKAFLETSGCTSLDSMALYLRLQLSPLDLANTDCINLEMSDMMGVTGKRAKKIIKDLNVFGETPDLFRVPSIHRWIGTDLLAPGCALPMVAAIGSCMIC